MIDWHEIEDPDGNVGIEMGAYDKKTFDLVIGIRIFTMKIEHIEYEEEDKNNQ